jgi:hypothetical protein
MELNLKKLSLYKLEAEAQVDSMMSGSNKRNISNNTKSFKYRDTND